MCIFNVERWASAGQAYREPGADLRNPARPWEELPQSRDAVCAQSSPTASEDGAAPAGGEGHSCHVRTGRLCLQQGLGEGKFEESVLSGFSFVPVGELSTDVGRWRRGVCKGMAAGRPRSRPDPGCCTMASSLTPLPPRTQGPSRHPAPGSPCCTPGPSLPCASGLLPPVCMERQRLCHIVTQAASVSWQVPPRLVQGHLVLLFPRLWCLRSVPWHSLVPDWGWRPGLQAELRAKGEKWGEVCPGHLWAAVRLRPVQKPAGPRKRRAARAT